jgi:hypothetical protein
VTEVGVRTLGGFETEVVAVFAIGIKVRGESEIVVLVGYSDRK